MLREESTESDARRSVAHIDVFERRGPSIIEMISESVRLDRSQQVALLESPRIVTDSLDSTLSVTYIPVCNVGRDAQELPARCVDVAVPADLERYRADLSYNGLGEHDVASRRPATLEEPDLFLRCRGVRQACGAGAHAAWLSGAGSSVAAICPEGQSREIAAAMLATAEAQGYSGRSLVTRIAREGATISKVELV